VDYILMTIGVYNIA